jgi:hypothetical protein
MIISVTIWSPRQTDNIPQDNHAFRKGFNGEIRQGAIPGNWSDGGGHGMYSREYG